MTNATITAKELARACDTSDKRIRSFVRNAFESNHPITTEDGSIVAPCGAGNRYGFSKAEANAIITAFASRRTTDHRSPARSKDDVLAWLSADDDADDDADDADGVTDDDVLDDDDESDDEA